MLKVVHLGQGRPQGGGGDGGMNIGRKYRSISGIDKEWYRPIPRYNND